MDPIRLVQLQHRIIGRRVALVDEPRLRLLEEVTTVHGLALQAIELERSIAERSETLCSGESLEYDEIYSGTAEWRLLAPIDHRDPAHCLVSGTGLTHLGSAQSRHEMHEKAQAEGDELTDSMRIYMAGVEGGRPSAGKVGVQPEWFYKGQGTVVIAPGETLRVPPFSLGCGEEAEVAAAYLIGPGGQPVRLGFCNANEFSDHDLEARNYLYLAPSKLCDCSIGPELVIGGGFDNLEGRVTIQRNGRVHWSSEILSGEENMSHSLANLEHHLFKFHQHRTPGDVHIHFLGADQLSCRGGVRTAPGDVIEVAWEGLGRPLRNPVSFEHGSERLVQVEPL